MQSFHLDHEVLSDTLRGDAALNKNLWHGVPMTAQRKIGRPSKGYGPRHTVAVQLSPEEFEVLQQITAELGVKPGPFLTEKSQALIAALKAEHVHQQEALPFQKAS